jgi:hypothetical protein
MGLLTSIDNWLLTIGRKPELDPEVIQVVQYGSTKSYTFRRDAVRGNLQLPEVPDQGTLISVLRATQQFYLPDLSDEDFDNLRQMLILIDDVILGGLKDPSNWVLPRGFSDIPFVKQRLDKNYPIDQILGSMLASTRLYVWLYRHDEAVSELIPHLLELEESFESLRTRICGEDGNREPVGYVNTLHLCAETAGSLCRSQTRLISLLGVRVR